MLACVPAMENQASNEKKAVELSDEQQVVDLVLTLFFISCSQCFSLHNHSGSVISFMAISLV